MSTRTLAHAGTASRSEITTGTTLTVENGIKEQGSSEKNPLRQAAEVNQPEILEMARVYGPVKRCRFAFISP